MISNCNHIFHKDCIMRLLASNTANEPPRLNACPSPNCNGYFEASDSIPMKRKDLLNSNEFDVKLTPRRYVSEGDILEKYPDTHQNLINVRLSLRKMYLYFKGGEYVHNELTSKQKKYSPANIPMERIEKAIKEMEELMIKDSDFQILANPPRKVLAIKGDSGKINRRKQIK